MSKGSDARRQRRALRSRGIVAVSLVSVERSAIAAVVTKGANLTDFLAYQVAHTLTDLDERGADLIEGTTVVTIGDHPDYPDALTIEAKASKLKAAVDHDPGCIIDHSLDAEDEPGA